MRKTLVCVGAAAFVVLWAVAGPLAQAYVRPGRVVDQADYVRGKGVPNGRSFGSSVSDSGRYIAFDTDIGLLPPDINGASDVYLRDTKTGRLWLASAASDGSVAVGTSVAKLSSCAFDPTVPGRWIVPLTPLSWDPAISGNGRYVAFVSWAPNLVGGDTNLAADVFVFDRKGQDLRRVSVNSKGEEATVTLGDESLCPASWSPSLDRSGKRVSFTSRADNLDGVDDNKVPDVFVHDTGSGHTERVSVPIEGVAQQPQCQTGVSFETASLCFTRPGSDDSSISADGRFVVFDSHTPDLVEDDTNRMPDVFVRDLKKKRTERASVDSSEAQIADGLMDGLETNSAAIQIKTATGGFISPAQHAISADGRFVVFFSDATDVIPNDHEGTDIYVRDMKAGRTERVSVLSTGEGYGRVPTWAAPAISGDGRFVTFPSYVDHDQFSGLPDDWLDSIGGVVYDRVSGAIELVSRTSSGAPGRGCRISDGTGGYIDQTPHSSVHLLDLNANGRYVSMSTCNTNMQVEPDNKPDRQHVLLVDRGLPLGFGGPGGRQSDAVAPKPEEGICVNPDVCIPPLGAISRTDPSGEDGVLGDDTDLIEARVASRPQHADLFVVLDVERLGSSSAPHLYGLRFTTGERRYDVRATSRDGGTFGLFDCSEAPRSASCLEGETLKGGFGTTGERIVFSLPLEKIGLGDGGELIDIEAYTALGGYQTGALKIIDRIAIR